LRFLSIDGRHPCSPGARPSMKLCLPLRNGRTGRAVIGLGAVLSSEKIGQELKEGEEEADASDVWTPRFRR
jgi:hypothetical protein